MAKYNKKRARELKHDKFRDTTMSLFDRLGEKLEGKGRTILYALGAAALVFALGLVFMKWRDRKTAEAEQAFGRAVEVASTPVSPSPLPGTTTESFPTETARAQRAAEEFQKVADKYGNPYHEKALYFVAANQLVLDRAKGVAQLEPLTKSSDREVAALAKFALAQAKEADAKYDEAAAVYRQLATDGGTVITPEVANLRLAVVYGKQGKKQEAAEMLFNIADAARKAKDQNGKAKPQTAAAREAAQELQKIDPQRYAKLAPEPPASEIS